MDINISLEDVACGNTIPVEIERWNLNREDNETYELEKHIEYYSLPFGVENGEVVLLTNCGNESANNMRGDVKVTFHVAEHDVFKRNGLDIHTEKTISLKEALCGFVFNIEHVNGKKFAFNDKWLSVGGLVQNNTVRLDSIKVYNEFDVQLGKAKDGLLKRKNVVTIQSNNPHTDINSVRSYTFPDKKKWYQSGAISFVLGAGLTLLILN